MRGLILAVTISDADTDEIEQRHVCNYLKPERIDWLKRAIIYCANEGKIITISHIDDAPEDFEVDSTDKKDALSDRAKEIA